MLDGNHVVDDHPCAGFMSIRPVQAAVFLLHRRKIVFPISQWSAFSVLNSWTSSIAGQEFCCNGTVVEDTELGQVRIGKTMSQRLVVINERCWKATNVNISSESIPVIRNLYKHFEGVHSCTHTSLLLVWGYMAWGQNIIGPHEPWSASIVVGNEALLKSLLRYQCYSAKTSHMS